MGGGGGGFMKNQFMEGLAKKGGLDHLREGLARKGVVFLRGDWYPQ